jgi:hypothetical protein
MSGLKTGECLVLGQNAVEPVRRRVEVNRLFARREILCAPRRGRSLAPRAADG